MARPTTWSSSTWRPSCHSSAMQLDAFAGAPMSKRLKLVRSSLSTRPCSKETSSLLLTTAPREHCDGCCRTTRQRRYPARAARPTQEAWRLSTRQGGVDRSHCTVRRLRAHQSGLLLLSAKERCRLG